MKQENKTLTLTKLWDIAKWILTENNCNTFKILMFDKENIRLELPEPLSDTLVERIKEHFNMKLDSPNNNDDIKFIIPKKLDSEFLIMIYPNDKIIGITSR